VTNRRTDRRRELRWLTRTTAVAAVARNKVMTSEALAGEKQRDKKKQKRKHKQKQYLLPPIKKIINVFYSTL